MRLEEFILPDWKQKQNASTRGEVSWIRPRSTPSDVRCIPIVGSPSAIKNLVRHSTPSVFLLTASRMRACACDTASQLCVRTALCSSAFSLAPPLRSTSSAAAKAALFARFSATSGRSDFSFALIVGSGLRPSRRGPGHDWWGQRWRPPGSRAGGFCACQGLRRRGAGSCLAMTNHLAFCWDGKHQRPELVLRRSIPSLRTPLSTLRLRPHDHTRMTRGRCSSLRLHRDGLAPSTFRRSPGAPVHHIIRVAPTSSKASPNVRYAFNSDRILRIATNRRDCINRS